MEYSYNDFIEELKLGSEIEFTYKNIAYFVTYDARGTILIKVDDKTKQIFKNDDDFLANATFDSKKIYQIWNDIRVDTIY